MFISKQKYDKSKRITDRRNKKATIEGTAKKKRGGKTRRTGRGIAQASRCYELKKEV